MKRLASVVLMGLAACTSNRPATLMAPAADGVVGKAVDYAHGDVKLEGYLATPKNAKGKLPGVLIVHEWRGHNDYVRRRADQVAELGYVAFALDMYGKGVYAKDHTEAAQMAGVYKKDRVLMRSRAKAGYDILAGQELCDVSKIVAFGYCFGGTTSLELGRAGTPLAGIATFHSDLTTPTPADAKNLRGKVISFNGADDPFVKPEAIQGFMTEMRDAKVDWRFVQFGGAVHSFTVKAAGDDPSKGMAYHAQADARSWEMLRDFLVECFN